MPYTPAFGGLPVFAQIQLDERQVQSLARMTALGISALRWWSALLPPCESHRLYVVDRRTPTLFNIYSIPKRISHAKATADLLRLTEAGNRAALGTGES